MKPTKTPKIKIHEFDPTIYPLKLWIVITEDLPEVVGKYVNGVSLEPFKLKGLDSDGAYTCFVKEKDGINYGSLIVFRDEKYLTMQTIAHESTHAARDIWDWLEESTTGCEADAYLVGWVAKCIEEVKNYKDNGQTS
jgi:hypothetical protein